MRELLFAILGAILGYFAQIIIPKLTTIYNTYYDKYFNIDYNKFTSNDKVFNGIIDYYTSTGNENNLFFCDINGYGERIPFITSNDWIHLNYNNLQYESVKFYTSNKKSFVINDKVINKRRSLGQKLFNNPCLYIDSIEKNEDGKFFFNVLNCDYFEMLTLLDRFEKETYEMIVKNKHPYLRKELMHSSKDAYQIKKKPISIGCQIAFVINLHGTTGFLIHQRSNETITFNDTLALLPVYGMSPPLNSSTENNMLLYNFLMEYCEEMYNYTQLENIRLGKKVDSKWFYDLPEACELIQLFEAGLARFELLGFGFDGFNGSLTLGCLVYIQDEAASLRIYKSIDCNWEVAEFKGNDEPLLFVPHNDSRLQQWLKEKKYHYGSAFTLSLALSRLREISSSQP